LPDRVENVTVDPKRRFAARLRCNAARAAGLSQTIASIKLDAERAHQGRPANDPSFWQDGLGVIERMITELESLASRYLTFLTTQLSITLAISRLLFSIITI
jgi:hypothetical protein